MAGLRQRSAGVRDLAAAVVGHVATDHESERLQSARPRHAVRSGTVDGFWPPVVVDRLMPAVPAQRVVGLALILAMRAQAVRHTAGVDVVREQEGDIEPACGNTSLVARAAAGPRRSR